MVGGDDSLLAIKEPSCEVCVCVGGGGCAKHLGGGMRKRDCISWSQKKEWYEL